MKVTTQDVTLEFMHHGEITIPKGTRVTNQTALGVDENYNFVDDLSWIDSPILRHDATYYGINVPKEFVTEA